MNFCKHCSYDISRHAVKVTTEFHVCPLCGTNLDKPITVKSSIDEGSSKVSVVKQVRKLQD